MLKPTGYVPRLLDEKIARLLKTSTIVEVDGPFGCGKSWSALAHGQSITHVDDDVILLPILQSDPRIALVGPSPHVIDEWLALPSLRDEAYRSASRHGSFILASSLAPDRDSSYVRNRVPTVVRLRLRTLSLAERGLSDASVSLSGLLDRRFSPSGRPAAIAQTAAHVCSGGWPRAYGVDTEAAIAVATVQLESILSRFLPSLGRKETVVLRMLRALALAAGRDSTYQAVSTLMAQDGSKLPSRNTVLAYERALQRLFLVEALPGWAAPVRSVSRVKTKPRLFVADPSIGALATCTAPDDLLADAQLFSALFKALALHDLLVYADALDGGAQLRYYADADGLQVDFVLLLPDGRWAALNAEIGDAQAPASIRRLERLRKKVAAGGSGLGEPAFMAVLLASSVGARQDAASGCYLLPLANLGA